MSKFEYTNSVVEEISQFLQNYMLQNNIKVLTADECAELLNKNDILTNKTGPKPGFNFRQMLRDGRDNKINQIEGVFQKKPNSRWYINHIQ